MEKFVDIFERAKVLIEHGWCQGSSGRDAVGRVSGIIQKNTCRWCASSSLAVAILEQGHPLPADVFFKCVDVLRLSNDTLPDDMSLAEWNDCRGRTAQDIVDLFDTAIGWLGRYNWDVIRRGIHPSNPSRHDLFDLTTSGLTFNKGRKVQHGCI